MTENDSFPTIGRLMRFGVPLVILIFYISASTGMFYTPDAAFRSLSCAASIAAGGDCATGAKDDPLAVSNPAWTLLLAAATSTGLDAVLAAKVLSLFFASLGILGLYLLAVEVIDDRLLAFGVTLTFAIDAWMQQAAPAGSAAAATVTVMLTAVFFLMRAEYILAAIFSGIATLLFWQAAPLLACILIDLFLNMQDRGRAVRLAGGVVLSFLVVLLLWAAYATAHRLPPWPGGQNSDIYTTGGGRTGSLLLMGLFMVVGIVAALRMRGERHFVVRAQLAVWLWMLWLVVASYVWDASLLFFLLPLLLIYAFAAVREVAEAFRRVLFMYPAALVLAAVLMLLSQLHYSNVTKPYMKEVSREMAEIRSLGAWMKEDLPPDAVVGSEWPGAVAYYSGRQVCPLQAGREPDEELPFLVTKRESIAGYEIERKVVPSDVMEESFSRSHFALWRKR